MHNTTQAALEVLNITQARHAIQNAHKIMKHYNTTFFGRTLSTVSIFLTTNTWIEINATAAGITLKTDHGMGTIKTKLNPVAHITQAAEEAWDALLDDEFTAAQN